MHAYEWKIRASKHATPITVFQGFAEITITSGRTAVLRMLFYNFKIDCVLENKSLT
jgi:hypothetical protein